MRVQSFRSEVFQNGATYPFVVWFTATRWSATIWDEEGQLHGAISCMAPRLECDNDELEDTVCDWVHRAVACEVGFFERTISDVIVGTVVARAAHCAVDDQAWSRTIAGEDLHAGILAPPKLFGAARANFIFENKFNPNGS